MLSKSPISIEVLETLDAIERRGSFARAAEELNKATSAVSYAVQKLEEQLDIALFQRQGRRSVLTPAGRLVLEEGREILVHTARLASKAREVATGWETHIRIAAESILSYEKLFEVLREFLLQHPGIGIDVTESVLNGGWELLERDRVDLVVGAPGPVPRHKGFRIVELPGGQLVPVIASTHEYAKLATDRGAISAVLAGLRRVITHDTSLENIKRSAGLSGDGRAFYVQTIDQKIHAIQAGIGIGHLPYDRIRHHLESGSLVELNIETDSPNVSYMAWKLNNKGKGLKALTDQLAATRW